MSTFKVEVLRIDSVEAHPNADALDVAVIGDSPCVVQKGRYSVGDLVIYFPVDAILPEAQADRLGVAAHLSHGRVKAVKLRGVVSLGLVIANEGNWPEETDLTEHYGVVRYDPPVPAKLGGQNVREISAFRRYTDIQHLAKWKSVLVPGEPVVITEKIHGTNWRAGLIDGKFFVGSRANTKADDDTIVYWQMAKKYNVEERMRESLGDGDWIVFGEAFGPGVQDLRYGCRSVEMRVFDIMHNHRYLDYDQAEACCESLGFTGVPLMYRGPFDQAIVNELTVGTAYQGEHVREGVVVKPVVERDHRKLGRVILKSINPAYKTRRKGTEYH